MFGFEKKKKPQSFFVFDLEKDLQDEKKQKNYLKHAEKHIADLKTQLREGAQSSDFENLGLMLHGYSALLKILTSFTKS